MENIQLYSCSNTFPSEIKIILQEHGFIIEPLHELNKHTDRMHGAFSMRIRRGQGCLRLLGTEDKGQYGFHLVAEPTNDEYQINMSLDLYDEVETLILTNGADFFFPED